MPNVSIIIRTKNEERWIADCLRAISTQEYDDFEIIVVDNESEDTTLEHVYHFGVNKVLHCTEYLPGKALNMGIQNAKGNYVVCLSGHCIPVNNKWLGNMLHNFNLPNVAGVYGRQQPLSFTPPSDKRDLLIIFGPEKRIQWKDSFFHNANSIIRRDVLTEIPFDDKVTNIEDRLWAQKVQAQGYCVVYEPEASVYHYHGIHQGQNEERCRNVVRILESFNEHRAVEPLAVRQAEGIAIIPIKGPVPEYMGANLLDLTIQDAKKALCVKKIVVSADTQEVVDEAMSLGCDIGILREKELSQNYITLEEVYRYTLDQLANRSSYGDFVVLLESKYPFRPQKLVDDMFIAFISQGADTIIPGRMESNSIWVERSNNNFMQVGEVVTPKKYKKPLYVGCKGLCCITWPGLIKSGTIFGKNISILPLNNPFAFVEYSDNDLIEIPEFVYNRQRLA